MTVRFIGPLLCGGLLLVATSSFAGGKISDNESPRPQDRTTVKSSKSNTSDRMGGGGGGKGASSTARTTTGNPILNIPWGKGDRAVGKK